jgi:glutamine amidotransferase
MIGLLDYGMGNLSSVSNALDYLGIDNQIVNTPETFSDISRLIIPGVGSYSKAMDNINTNQYLKEIKDFEASGKPILGICLGMQLLSFIGTEPYRVKGLELINGEVTIFPQNIGIRIPHVGWNGINLVNEHPILEGVKLSADFYFVHSYYFSQAKSNNIIASTNYGIDFPSIICNDSKNVIGIQFHPEKSQKQGLKILENFSKIPYA